MLTVDRTSDRWLRLRANCGHAASYFDLDRHADNVWLTVETTAAGTNPQGVRGGTNGVPLTPLPTVNSGGRPAAAPSSRNGGGRSRRSPDNVRPRKGSK